MELDDVMIELVEGIERGAEAILRALQFRFQM